MDEGPPGSRATRVLGQALPTVTFLTLLTVLHHFTEQKSRRRKLKIFAQITQLKKVRVGLQALAWHEAACQHQRKGTCPIMEPGMRWGLRMASSAPHRATLRSGREKARGMFCHGPAPSLMLSERHPPNPKMGHPWRGMQPCGQCAVHTQLT